MGAASYWDFAIILLRQNLAHILLFHISLFIHFELYAIFYILEATIRTL